MKILFVGNFNIHAYAVHWQGIKMAALSLSDDVEAQFHDFRQTNEGVTISRIIDCAPDVVVFCIQDAMTDACLNAAKEVGAFTALWFCDLRRPEPRNLSGLLDLLFMTNIGYLDAYAQTWRIGKDRALYLPQACLPKKEIPASNPNHACDVLHIGSEGHPEFHADRRATFAALRTHFGSRFRALDPHRDEEKADVTAMLPSLYASARLSIGISANVAGYHSNRLFLATGNGAFYLCNYFFGIEDLFEPGKELIAFDPCDKKDVAETVEAWLQDNLSGDREQIRKAGFFRAQAQHTYPCRVKNLINEIRHRM